MEAGNKGRERSFVSRVFCTETLICCAGVACVVYGLAQGVKIMQLFFGLCIIGGSFALRVVKRKDWDAHWAELERVRLAHEQRVVQERERKD